jgi:hypothetical protein
MAALSRPARTMRRALFALPLAFVLSLGCGGSDNGGTGSTGPVDGGTDGGTTAGLVAITLSQTDIHIPEHQNTAFAVTGTYGDGTRQDVTQQADAVSSNTQVATLQKGPGSQIQVFSQDPGTATITVTVGAARATCNVTVTQR